MIIKGLSAVIALALTACAVLWWYSDRLQTRLTAFTARIAQPVPRGSAPSDIAILIAEQEAGRRRAICQIAAIEAQEAAARKAIENRPGSHKVADLHCKILGRWYVRW